MFWKFNVIWEWKIELELRKIFYSQIYSYCFKFGLKSSSYFSVSKRVTLTDRDHSRSESIEEKVILYSTFLEFFLVFAEIPIRPLLWKIPPYKYSTQKNPYNHNITTAQMCIKRWLIAFGWKNKFYFHCLFWNFST